MAEASTFDLDESKMHVHVPLEFEYVRPVYLLAKEVDLNANYTANNQKNWRDFMLEKLRGHSIWEEVMRINMAGVGGISRYLSYSRVEGTELHRDNKVLEVVKMACSAEMLPHIAYAQSAQEAWDWIRKVDAWTDLEKASYYRMLETAAVAKVKANSDDVPEVDKLLTRRNYGKWKRYMQNVLLSKYLWTLVDGSDTPESPSYRKKNLEAFKILRMSCGKEMSDYIYNENNAKDAWHKLEGKLGTTAASSTEERKDSAAVTSNLNSDEIIIDYELLTGTLVYISNHEFRETSNYQTWESCMRNYLINQGLWGFLEEQQISDCVKDEKALDAIKASCAPEMQTYIQYMGCAKHAWEALAKLFDHGRELGAIFYSHRGIIKEATKIKANLSKYSEADKVLTRSNYPMWEEYVTMLLKSRFLSEVIQEDGNDKYYRIKGQDHDNKVASALRIIKEACGPDMIHYIIHSEFPKEAWDSLRKASSMDQKDDYLKYSRLLHAIQKNGFREQIQDRNGKLWKGAHNFFRDHPEALTAEITEDGSTALHIAVRLGRVDFVRELLNLMTNAQSGSKTPQGNTAMATAAGGNNMEIVQMLENFNPHLLVICNEHGLHAVTVAAINGNEMILRYLYPSTDKSVYSWDATSVASLLTSAARLDAFDIVRDLLSHFPDYALAQDAYGMTLLMILAEKPSAFPSGNQFGLLGGFIYRLAGYETHQTMLKALKTIFPGVKQVLDSKEKHDDTAVIVQKICSLLPNLDPNQLKESSINDAIHRSTTQGIIEVFENLIDTNPYLEHYKDENERGLFQLAIMARQENIFQYLYQMGPRNQSMAFLDKFGNNALHCVAYWDPSSQLDKVHGPALQMQRELQWFEEVERVVPPRYAGMKNKENGKRNKKQKTPREIFSLEHKGLAKEGEKWMKETAQACMIVTTLIATVMFAAAFTLPGGSDQNTGTPLSANTPAFKVFIISDAISLFSSCTSVLMFFAILISRYSERDFLTSLPKKMILGLSTLFISIATMMATFAATLVIVLRGQASWVYIPVSILASIPVLLFGLLQLPLFINILSSTYGRGIFHKKRVVLAPLTGISYG